MKFNTQSFLTAYESEFKKLTRSQRAGLTFLMDKINADTYDMLEHVAYVLATAYWESGRTFQPVKEKRAGRLQAKLRTLQDRYWFTGFFGRGLVQITWEENYEKFGIADNPDKALEPETAYEILSTGMKKGMFAKDKNGKPHTLARYIRPGRVDYKGARKIINGTDKDALIAGFAIGMERALRKALEPEVTIEPGPAPVETPSEAKPEKVDVLSSVGGMSGDTLKKGGSVAAKVLKSFWARITTALTVGGYFELSIYILLVIILSIVIFHYRKQILDFGKKLVSKVQL
jgi:hypothetical protein